MAELSDGVIIELLESIKKSFGRRLRALRESRGYSRDTVAQNAKIDPTSLYRVENGQQWIAPETLERISNFFGVSPAVFFTDTIVRIDPTPDDALKVLETLVKASKQKNPG